jgi:hypothetical protein
MSILPTKEADAPKAIKTAEKNRCERGLFHGHSALFSGTQLLE